MSGNPSAFLGTLAVIVLFILTRAAMLTQSWRVSWDVYYYWFGPHHGRAIAELLTEYPTPVAWALSGLHALFPELPSFRAAFTLLMVGLDALTAVLLWRRSLRAGLVWLAFGTAIGVISYHRIDLLTATPVALALLWASARPKAAGALLGLAAAFKLWPALLAPALVAGADGQRRARLLGFTAVGGGLGLASLLLAGWARSVSPLTWQAERGLQIESVAATPLVVGRVLSPDAWHVGVSEFNAVEIAGPGTDAALLVTSVANVLAVVIAAALAWRLSRRPSAEGLAVCVIAITAWMIVVNKTFSPQYLWWLAGPVAIWCIWAASRRQMFIISGSMIALALATGLIFPWCYDAITDGYAAGMVLLAARNAGMVAFAVWALLRAWRVTGDFRVASEKQA
ncbi:MAG: glycosyltransferase 87 family protein [Propionibacteriaceae bacterium]|nr:glycosyltransferase 87 family protein [Propionibacteriaceae bacterium]